MSNKDKDIALIPDSVNTAVPIEEPIKEKYSPAVDIYTNGPNATNLSQFVLEQSNKPIQMQQAINAKRNTLVDAAAEKAAADAVRAGISNNAQAVKNAYTADGLEIQKQLADETIRNMQDIKTVTDRSMTALNEYNDSGWAKIPSMLKAIIPPLAAGDAILEEKLSRDRYVLNTIKMRQAATDQEFLARANKQSGYSPYADSLNKNVQQQYMGQREEFSQTTNVKTPDTGRQLVDIFRAQQLGKKGGGSGGGGSGTEFVYIDDQTIAAENKNKLSVITAANDGALEADPNAVAIDKLYSISDSGIDPRTEESLSDKAIEQITQAGNNRMAPLESIYINEGDGKFKDTQTVALSNNGKVPDSYDSVSAQELANTAGEPISSSDASTLEGENILVPVNNTFLGNLINRFSNLQEDAKKEWSKLFGNPLPVNGETLDFAAVMANLNKVNEASLKSEALKALVRDVKSGNLYKNAVKEAADKKYYYNKLVTEFNDNCINWARRFSESLVTKNANASQLLSAAIGEVENIWNNTDTYSKDFNKHIIIESTADNKEGIYLMDKPTLLLAKLTAAKKDLARKMTTATNPNERNLAKMYYENADIILSVVTNNILNSNTNEYINDTLGKRSLRGSAKLRAIYPILGWDNARTAIDMNKKEIANKVQNGFAPVGKKVFGDNTPAEEIIDKSIRPNRI